MKTIYLILFIFTISFCKAQTYSLLDDGIGSQSGAYYKDNYNDFNKFVGTWKYQSGNVLFEIKFQKKAMLYSTESNSYSDMLIGEYRYVDLNGNEIVNTYPYLQLDLGPYKNNIAGKYIRDKNKPMAERRVQLYFSDPERDYLNREIIVKHLPASGNTPERIAISFTGEGVLLYDQSLPTSLRVPEQDYILTKVN